ncbi:MAG TPA: hypothetical protein VGB55_02435 [Tepidisphaeraceae bacterium]
MPLTRYAVAFSLCLAACAAAQETPEQWIEQLGDRDAAVRQEASAKLRAAGLSARPALVKAAGSGKLGIADEAAAILMPLPWWQDEDNSPVRRALSNYGNRSPQRRATVIATMADLGDKGLKAAVRVLQEEPSQQAKWRAASLLSTKLKFSDYMKTLPPPLSPQLEFVALRNRVHGAFDQPLSREDRDAIDALFETLWASEVYDIGIIQVLTEHQIVDSQLRRDRRDNLAALRRRVMVADVGPGEMQADDFQNQILLPGAWNAESARNDLITFHLNHSPLPGMNADLLAAIETELPVRSSTLLGYAAERLGAPVAGALLKSAFDDQIAELPNPDDRALARIQLANWLNDIGEVEQSEQLLLSIEEMGLEESSRVLFQARMNLYVRYDTEENDTGAIIKIEQLKNHPAGIIPAKAGEAWTPRQMDLEIAWRRWRLVRDKEVVDPKVVQAVMDAATEDSTIVMDVVTWLDTQNRSKEADALFEKRYAPARAKVDLNPADPHYNNALAWICARSNRRLDEALAAAEKAVSARPTEAAYLDTLAEVKFRLGDIEDAISLEERALLGRPRDVFMAAQLDRFRKALSSNQK